MWLVLMVLAQIQTVPPLDLSSCGNDSPVATRFKVDAEREITVVRDALGRPMRAVVRRVDGKPMTCEPITHGYPTSFPAGRDAHRRTQPMAMPEERPGRTPA